MQIINQFVLDDEGNVKVEVGTPEMERGYAVPYFLNDSVNSPGIRNMLSALEALEDRLQDKITDGYSPENFRLALTVANIGNVCEFLESIVNDNKLIEAYNAITKTADKGFVLERISHLETTLPDNAIFIVNDFVGRLQRILPTQ